MLGDGQRRIIFQHVRSDDRPLPDHVLLVQLAQQRRYTPQAIAQYAAPIIGLALKPSSAAWASM